MKKIYGLAIAFGILSCLNLSANRDHSTTPPSGHPTSLNGATGDQFDLLNISSGDEEDDGSDDDNDGLPVSCDFSLLGTHYCPNFDILPERIAIGNPARALYILHRDFRI